MRWFLTYIFGVLALSGFSQNVYNKVRRNMCDERAVNELYTVDSCYNKAHYKDSALFYKSLINLKIGRCQSARRSARVLEKLYPDFKELHYLNGLILFYEEDYGKSVEAFNLAIKDDPANIKVYYNRSVALGLMDEYMAAIEDLNTCIRLNPDYALARYSRAYWHEFTGNYADAVKDYEDVIRLDPKN
ncbi:MAG: tetratricopeptide repeat protein [Bacteroidota bacterium]